MSCVFQNIDPPPTSPPGECVPRLRCGGEDTLAGWKGGGGSIFWKTPDTALYSTYVSTLWLRLLIIIEIERKAPDQRWKCILFSVVFTPSPPQPPRQCLIPTCHLDTLNYSNTISPVRACRHLVIWWERFGGTPKEDYRGPLSIQSSLRQTVLNVQ